MINIAELLRNATKGLKLYSPLFGEVEFAEVMDTDYVPIRVMKRGYGLRFDEYGRYMGNEYPDSECLLFPSKDCRTWVGWKLTIEPKFKVGDWIVRCEGFVYEPSLITEIRDYYICELLNGERVTYTLNDVHKNFHLWTIANAKDGDVLVTTKIRNCPFIYRKTSRNNGLAYYYAGVDGDGNFCEGCLKRTLYHFGPVENVVPATKEQRDLLFAKIKEAGYQWDANKKELRKIQPHYDIKNFHVGMPVLVRADNNCRWDYSVFSRITGNEDWPFAVCNGVSFTQCIPFEGNENLLGTTDMPSEEYINW